MSASTISFYITGGTLPSGASSYIERQADTDLYEGLSRGEYCYVLHARQMGKSSLMVHTAVRLREEGVAVAVLDLTLIGQNLSAEQWYDGLLARLGQQLDLEEELDDFWVEQERLSPLQRWLAALNQVVLARCPGRVVIFVDEIDAVRSLPFSTDEFFAAIRACYNRRSEDPAFARLTFCLLGVATPSDLIQDVRTTPFNVGRRIELSDFSEPEATALAPGLGRDETTAAALLQRVIYWTGGHPYLTQRLCRAAAEDFGVTDAAGVDRHCEILFLAAAAREKDDNLLFVRERLLRSGADVASLLDLYAAVRRGERVPPDDTSQLVSLLRLSGIARVEDGTLRVRNRIYEQVFDREWIVAHLPDAELRRQRAAYRRGLLRATAVAAVILAVVVSLALAAVRQAQRADRQRRLADQQRAIAQEGQRALRLNLYASQMNLAQQAWQAGKMSGALDLLNAWRPAPGQEDLRGFEWRYLWRLCQGDQRFTLPGLSQTGLEAGTGLSPDGHLLAVPGAQSIRLWDLRSRRPVGSLRGHRDGVLCFAFSPDGQWLASGGSDQLVRLWDLGSRRELAHFGGAASAVTSVILSPDARILAATGFDRVLRFWELASRREVTVPDAMKQSVVCAAFSPNGRIFAAGHGDGTVKLWNWASRRPVGVLRGHTGAVKSLAFSPDGKRLATTSWDGTVRLWDLARRAEAGQLKGHRGAAWSVAFSPDGERLATGGDDSTVRLWDAGTRAMLAICRGHQKEVIHVLFSPDGKQLVSTGGEDGTVKVWDVSGSADRDVLRGHKGWIGFLTFTPGGKLLVSGSDDNTIKLWDVATHQVVATRAGPHVGISALALSPDGKRLAIATDDRRIEMWRVAVPSSGQQARRRPTLNRYAGWRTTLTSKQGVSKVVFSPDGKTLAIIGRNPLNTEPIPIMLWDVGTQRKVVSLPEPVGNTVTAAFSPDGRLLASADQNVVKLWDLTAKRLVASLPGHKSDMVSDLAFSADGKILASAGWDQTVRLWDPASKRALGTLSGYAGIVYRIAFSPDGKRLAAGCADGTITLWDLATLQKVATLQGHDQPVGPVAFSPDGSTLASAGADTTIRLWHAPPFSETDPLRIVSVSGSDRSVALQWQPLPWALGYVVYRGTARVSHAPLVKLTPQPLTASSFTDRSSGLVNGRPETYEIAAVYEGTGSESGRHSIPDSRHPLLEAPRVRVQATPAAVPPGWAGSSINEGERSGSARFDPTTGTISLLGSGRDIWDEADGCYFLNQPVSGDFEITVQVLTAPTESHEWAKVGLMVRESLDAGARNAYLCAPAAHGLNLQWRPVPDEATNSAPVIQDRHSARTILKLPILLRLIRQGSSVTASYSRDGAKSFQPAGKPVSFDHPLPTRLFVGLAITSHDAGKISEANLSGLRVERQ